jgi:hypothetical protein
MLNQMLTYQLESRKLDLEDIFEHNVKIKYQRQLWIPDVLRTGPEDIPSGLPRHYVHHDC